jgi:DNA-binding CsgD family transcriptional regulator
MSSAQTQAGRTPDGITPLVGYRCWSLSISPGHGELLSLNGQIARQVDLDDPLGQRADPWLVAQCLNNDHDAPQEGCSCGFYALKSLSALGRVLLFATPRAWLCAGGVEPGATSFPVAGCVDLAGKVIEHELGYRAERMRITELRALAGTEQTVTQFARRLGVSVGESIPDPSIIEAGSVSGSMTTEGGAERHLLERLTPREVQVLRLLASGTASAEIAANLASSHATVRNHVQNILVKLQVHSRLEAVARMLRHPPPPDSAA